MSDMIIQNTPGGDAEGPIMGNNSTQVAHQNLAAQSASGNLNPQNVLLTHKMNEAGSSVLSQGGQNPLAAHVPGKHNGIAKNVRNFKYLYQNPNNESDKARQMCDKFRLGDGSSREMLQMSQNQSLGAR